MKAYMDEYSTKEGLLKLTQNRKSDFINVELALELETPRRPTTFELFLNDPFFEDLLGEKCPKRVCDTMIARNKFLAKGFKACGYDYVTINCPNELYFPGKPHASKDTTSLNEGFMITDVESFNNYSWPDPKTYDFSYLKPENLNLPKGMKVMVIGPGGVLENMISLLGFNNLCIALFEKPDFVMMVADKVGGILYDYYEQCLKYETVGGCWVNDDWGFKTQTMLSPKDMRKYIIPWHEKITELIHKNERYAVMHSCGNLWEVMDDIINTIKSDAKHSYEDAITTVEESYEILKGKIAVVGGIDVDYMCKKTPKEIYDRAIALLLQTKDGGYMLGTGNSIPEYIPYKSVYSMLCAAMGNEY